jgi:hypothetical protein
VNAARKAKRNVTARIFPEDDHLFLVLPTSQKMQQGELTVPHALDPRLAQAILVWMNALK